MKKIYLLFIGVLFFLGLDSDLKAQSCPTCTAVTTFTANLTANPNNTYTVSSVRTGQCCQGTGSDNCVVFQVSVHPQASQIRFFKSGGNNGTYEINCAPPIHNPTDVVCLGGLTNFCITYCNPGNNNDTYTITTSSGLSTGADLHLRAGCSGKLTVGGLTESSITWTSAPTNTVYNTYLNPISGNDTTTVTPPAGSPAFIDYKVCGNATGCSSGTYCDTQRVYISPGLSVAITPTAPVVCSGVSTTLTVTASGGTTPYTYSWSPGGATTSTLSVSAAGTYTASVNDASTCGAVTQTISVGSSTTPTITSSKIGRAHV